MSPRRCAPPMAGRVLPRAAGEVPAGAGASGNSGAKRAEPGPARARLCLEGEDEEGASGALSVLCVVPAFPGRHHPQVRGAVWGRVGCRPRPGEAGVRGVGGAV